MIDENLPAHRSLYQHILERNNLHDDDVQVIEQPAAADDIEVNSNQAVNNNESLFDIPARPSRNRNQNRNSNIANENRNRNRDAPANENESNASTAHQSNRNQTTHIRDARPAR